MDEACAYAQLQLLHGFCPLILFRGADSVREFEQICLVNPQHHRQNIDSSCETLLQNYKIFMKWNHTKQKKLQKDIKNV